MDLATEICKLPPYWIAGLWLADKLLEYWLGKTKKVKAGSIIEAFQNVLWKKPEHPHQEIIMAQASAPALTKSFDTAQLVARLKAKGLDVTEELIMIMVGETMDWTQESLVIHPNTYLKFMAPVISTIKPLILVEVDKIDGEVG